MVMSEITSLKNYVSAADRRHQSQSVMLGTSPMPPTSKNKSGLVKVPVHFNVF